MMMALRKGGNRRNSGDCDSDGKGAGEGVSETDRVGIGLSGRVSIGVGVREAVRDGVYDMVLDGVYDMVLDGVFDLVAEGGFGRQLQIVRDNDISSQPLCSQARPPFVSLITVKSPALGVLMCNASSELTLS
jgi:hypothetical protein